MSEEQIRQALRAALIEHGPGTLGEGGDLPANLLQVVDSFGFVQIIMAIEAALGISADLDDVDLEELVHLDNLVSFLQMQS